MKNSNRQFYAAKYCAIAISIFTFSIVSSASASELKQSDRQRAHFSFSQTQSLSKLVTTGREKSDLNNNKKTPAHQTLAQKVEASSQSERSHPHRFSIGPDLFYRDYREEEITPGFKSNEYGTMYGLQATYDYVKGNSIFAGGSFRYGGGTTTYDGALQTDPPQPNVSTTDNKFLNVEGRLGYTFSGDKQQRFLISPFFALGYHKWDRDISGESPTPARPQGVANVVENYSWLYMGPGLQTKYQLSPQFDIGINAKVMMMVNGQIEVTLKDPFTGQVSGADGGSLGNALQYEVEFPITYYPSPDSNSNINLKLTPYYRSQNIGRGPDFRNSIGVREPASKTSVYGVTLAGEFTF